MGPTAIGSMTRGASAPPSARVVKDDAQGVPLARSQAADAMAKIDAIDAACALHGTVMHGENDRVAAAQRHDFRARLHARPLLGQDELTTSAIHFGQLDESGFHRCCLQFLANFNSRPFCVEMSFSLLSPLLWVICSLVQAL